MEPKRLRNRNINEVKNQSDLEHDFEANLSQLGPPRGASWRGISVIFGMFFACYVGRRFRSNFGEILARPGGTRGPALG